MGKEYTLILKNGYIIDTQFEGFLDIGIANETIVTLAEDLNPDLADQTLDLKGLTVIPGIIDSHAHLSPVFGGLAGHTMLAKAGVTTVLDMAGPSATLFEGAVSTGTGLNILSVEAMVPGRNISSNSPAPSELAHVLQKVQDQGGLGLKIMGTPYALTPEASYRVIQACGPHGYVAVHAGSTNQTHDFAGFLEMVDIIGDYPAHLAHINVYCRHPERNASEAKQALQILARHPHINTESYLSSYSAATGKVIQSELKSIMLRNNLKILGFSPDPTGLEQAILQGQAIVCQRDLYENLPLIGQAGVDYWKTKETRADIFIAVNPWMARILLTVSKTSEGEFIIPSLSSDGGGLLRNSILSMGLALIDLGIITLPEFICKTSFNPAKMLGLTTKGQIKPGFDADLTIIDLSAKKAIHSLALGQFILRDCQVHGQKATAYILTDGQAYLDSLNLKTKILDSDKFYNRDYS